MFVPDDILTIKESPPISFTMVYGKTLLVGIQISTSYQKDNLAVYT